MLTEGGNSILSNPRATIQFGVEMSVTVHALNEIHIFMAEYKRNFISQKVIVAH
jgi:hypothetical protein